MTFVSGRVGAEPISEMSSLNLRHDHVGEDEVYFRSALPGDQALRVFAMGGFQNFGSRGCATLAPRDDAHRLHPRAPWIASEPVSRRPGLRYAGAGGEATCGRKMRKGRPVTKVALHQDLAAALPNDAVTGGQTEVVVARFFLGREKGF